MVSQRSRNVNHCRVCWDPTRPKQRGQRVVWEGGKRQGWHRYVGIPLGLGAFCLVIVLLLLLLLYSGVMFISSRCFCVNSYFLAHLVSFEFPLGH